MLDASIVSNPVHRPQGRVFDRIAMHGGAAVCVSIITAAKLRHGCIGKALRGWRRTSMPSWPASTCFPSRGHDTMVSLAYAKSERTMNARKW